MSDELIGRMISMVDLTDLSDGCSAGDVARLCDRAERAGVAAVCVWPDFVADATAHLAGSTVRVATVANFPSGAERAYACGVVMERALVDGADEIDVVLPYRAWLAGDTDRAGEMLSVARELTGAAGAALKVILETGELPEQQIAPAARYAIDAGADFIKTSTGKTPVSATPGAVSVMLDVISSSRRPIGIKPSGGIAGFDDALEYLEMAETAWGVEQVTAERLRFGASRLLDDLEARLAR
jgi:deoxyribose-phosphate aldolase